MSSIIEKLLHLLKRNQDFFNVSFGHIISTGLAGLFFFILAYIMEVDSYGELGFLFAIALLSTQVSLLGFVPTKIIKISKGENKIKSLSSVVVLLSGIILGAIIAILLNNIFIFFLVISQAFFLLSTADYLGEKKYKIYAQVLIGQKTVQLLLAIILFYLLDVNGILLGISIASMIFGIKSCSHLSRFSLDISEFKKIFRLLMHSYSLELSKAVLFFSDKIIIAPLFGFTVLGIYQIASQFLLALLIIPTILFHYLLSEEASGKNKAKLRIKGILICLVLGVIMFFTPPVLIPEFLPNFEESILPAQIMALGLIPITVSYSINSKLLSSEMSKPVLISSLIFVCSEFVLLYYFGNMWQVVGLSIALVISSSLQAIFLLIVYVMIYKKTKKEI